MRIESNSACARPVLYGGKNWQDFEFECDVFRPLRRSLKCSLPLLRDSSFSGRRRRRHSFFQIPLQTISRQKTGTARLKARLRFWERDSLSTGAIFSISGLQNWPTVRDLIASSSRALNLASLPKVSIYVTTA